MSLIQYKDCDGCEALWYCYFVEAGCLLYYSNTKQGEDYIPLEPCPKPLTKKDFKLEKLATREAHHE